MLEVKKINSFYGDSQTLWDVSLTIGEEEIVTLIGANGAGKSTIMRTITGLMKPKTGNIVFDGISIDNLPAHKIVDLGISMVPEGRRLFPDMTVIENLEVGSTTNIGHKFRSSNMEWVFELFPVLKERVRQVAGTLSGGEQQMLAIGRALMAQPKLLLIDEMSLGLSPVVAENILSILQDLNKTKKLAIALVEQDVEAAFSISKRAYIVEHGRIVAEGDSKTMQCDSSILEAYLSISSNTEIN